jgi:hypothetical protein
MTSRTNAAHLIALMDSLSELATRGATEGEREAAARALAKMESRRQKATPNTEPYRFEFEGENYRDTASLSTKEVAALIRAEIKAIRTAARRAGVGSAELAIADPIAAAITSLPREANVTVRRDYAGWHSIIRITVRKLEGENWWRMARGYVQWNGYENTEQEPHAYPTAALAEVGDALGALANAYNYDNSDPMTDYYNKRFSLDVDAIPPGEKYGRDIHYCSRWLESVREWIA